MDLFSARAADEEKSGAPLAYRMRPKSLDEMVGQNDVIGPNTLLRRMIETDRLFSIVLFGPPGTGKTTLAEVIAHATKSRFEKLNAVTAGVADIRQVISVAKDELSMYGRKTVLFIDEIHRFNKAQQDALLPHVEAGLVALVGATTENPYFAVNSALMSRSQIFRLQPLEPSDVRTLISRALTDEERGLGLQSPHVTENAINLLIQHAAGDARRALNALELAVLAAEVGPDGTVMVDEEAVRGAVQDRLVVYDKSGDEHYDTISAFIKSVRGSDADAAILWLAKMLVAGEDPAFIARRLMILASEDIGNADPHALVLAQATHQTVVSIGMPEGRIALAQCTTYLATAKKSNAAYNAINRAMDDVQAGIKLTVPSHLRGTGYAGAARLGSGAGYLYPHDYPNHFVEQNYWPVGVEPKTYYLPEEDKP